LTWYSRCWYFLYKPGQNLHGVTLTKLARWPSQMRGHHFSMLLFLYNCIHLLFLICILHYEIHEAGAWIPLTILQYVSKKKKAINMLVHFSSILCTFAIAIFFVTKIRLFATHFLYFWTGHENIHFPQNFVWAHRIWIYTCIYFFLIFWNFKIYFSDKESICTWDQKYIST
jgi:hypothetical protein